MIENAVESHDDYPLKVVGILKPTQNVIDRLILTNLESIWHLHEHEDENDNQDHTHANEDITALLIKFKNKRGLLFLPRNINENTSISSSITKISAR